MKKSILLKIGVAGGMALASAAARGEVMTFDPLPADFAMVTSYTEDGIQIASGSPNHFHTVSDGSGGTAALFFQSDGFPQTVTFSGGTYTLSSIDFLFGFSGGIEALFTSSSGSVETVSSIGTHDFGSGFSGISFFTIAFQNGDTGSGFTLDNIRLNATSSVPEPATWAMMLFGFGAVGFAMRRRKIVALAA
jgi:hypothetical protein